METAEEIINIEPASKPELRQVVSQFWFCTYPIFSSQLLFSARREEALQHPAVLEVYDCDGELVNEAVVSFKDTSLGVLDLEPFVAACKLESGMKHGRVLVRSSQHSNIQCRVSQNKGGSFLANQQDILRRRDVFFPLTFSPDRTNYICLANQSTEDSTVRFRIFCGSRTPKQEVVVPALGARIVQLESLFPEYGYIEDKLIRAYVRLSVRAGGLVSCATFDRLLLQADMDQYKAVS